MSEGKGPFDVLIYCGRHMSRYILPLAMDSNITVSVTGGSGRALDLNLVSKGGRWFAGDSVELHAGSRAMFSVGRDVPTFVLRELTSDVTDFMKYDIGGRGQLLISKTGEKVTVSGDRPPEPGETLALLSFDRDGNAFLKTESKDVYKNGENREGIQGLSFGESFYADEVCFVYIGTALAVNRPDKTNVDLGLLAAGTAAETGGAAESTPPKFLDFPRSTQVRVDLEPITEDIDPPPAPKQHNPPPFWLQAGASLSMFVVMAASLLVRVSMGASNQLLVVVSTFSIFGSMAGMVVFPRLMRIYQAKKAAREEKERRDKYGEYLKIKETKFQDYWEKDAKLLNVRYPSAESSLAVVLDTARILWGRTPVFHEFLDIRIGSGLRAALHRAGLDDEGFTLVKDPCRSEAEAVAGRYQFMDGAPFSIALAKNPVVGIYGHWETCLALLRSVIVQITALHSYDDVKIILLYDNESEYLSFARWFPHIWNHDRTFRYAARNKNEVDNIFARLKPVFDERDERKERQKNLEEVFIPHYIVISLSPALLKNEAIHSRFLSNYEDLNGMGISFIVVDRDISGTPVLSNILIQCKNSGETHIYINDGRSRSMNMIPFIPDLISGATLKEAAARKTKEAALKGARYWWNPPGDWPALARHMYRIRTMDTSENNLIPHSVSFLGMYGAGAARDLDIRGRWSRNDSARSIQAPIGTYSSGSFTLDIHERGAGPHGLVAGTTGSGKSEFIQTLVLSLAVNYSPDDIAFVIIDYKGGGTANIFNTLPHLAGCVTNLSGNQIKRSLMSISSELLRRQRLIAECGDVSVNSVDKYNDLRKSKPSLSPMPHLILIADEFAELKKEEPAFMDELISASRIGRSLGVHLLLATQSPSGVVSDQIWNNTRFRVCLKVSDKTASNEVLKKPDAADITNAGRAYVQVGNNEIYAQVQTGYGGAPFRSGAGTDLAEVFYVQHNGEINPALSAKEREYEGIDVSKKIPSQLEVVLDEIVIVSKDWKRYTLWLPPLPEVLFMSALRGREDFPDSFDALTGWEGRKNFRRLAPAVGLADDVRNQKQPLLTVDFEEDGHLVLYGVKGSGKTTFLGTLIYSLAGQYTPEEVHLYIVDYDMGSLISYKDRLPHIGGVVLPDDEERLQSLFNHLERQAAERRSLFSAAGFPGIKQYNASKSTGSRDRLPGIIVIIHNFEAFSSERESYKERARELIRDCDKAGIYFVLTCGTRAALPSNIQRHIKRPLCLQMNEAMDYKITMNIREDLTPEPVNGRGVAKLNGHLVEFQTCLAWDDPLGGQTSQSLSDAFCGAVRSYWDGPLPPALLTIPNPFLFRKEMSEGEYGGALRYGYIPIGYNKSVVSVVSLRVQDIGVFPIIGGPMTGKTNLLQCLSELCAMTDNGGLYILDAAGDGMSVPAGEILNRGGEAQYAGEKESLDKLVKKLHGIAASRKGGGDFPPVYVFIDDIMEFYKMADESSVLSVDGIMSLCGKLRIYFFVTGGKVDALKGSTKIYDRMFSYGGGILLGGNFEAYPYFRADVKYGKDRSALFPEGTGYLFSKGGYSLVTTPQYGIRSV